MNTELKDILKMIIDEQGRDVLTNEKIFLAFLADYAPHLTREWKLLKIAYMEQIVTGLYSEIVEKEKCNLSYVASRYSQKLQDNTAMNKDTANQLVEIICSVIANEEITRKERALGSPHTDLYSLCVLAQMEAATALDIFDNRYYELEKFVRATAKDFIVFEDVEHNIFQIDSDLTENSYAYVLLGDLYLEGIDIEIDERKAIGYYKKAAEMGNHHGEFQYAAMLYYGKGVEANQEEGFYWYEKAAKHGNSYGASAMGWFYANGKFVEQDLQQAFKWYEIAALDGDGTQIVTLGNCYHSGFGVEKDLSMALRYYKEAAEKNNDAGRFNVGYMYYYGEGVAKDDEKAFEYFASAAKNGYAAAQYHLGEMYYRVSVRPDMEKTLNSQSEEYQYLNKNEKELYWMKKAAEQDSAEAYCYLAALYFVGSRVEKNLSMAKDYVNKAIEIADSNAFPYLDAEVLLGEICEEEENFYLAHMLYEKAATQNHPRGMYKMGMKEYELGDYKEAVWWFQKAAAFDVPEACGMLAELYGTGKGVKKDLFRKRQWKKKEEELYARYEG